MGLDKLSHRGGNLFNNILLYLNPIANNITTTLLYLSSHYLNIKKTYLPIYTNSTEISAGFTPLIRLAIPNVVGRIFANFWRASVLNEGIIA